MMVAFLWTGGVYRNRLQDFRARILVFVILLVQLSNETISTYRSNRLPLCNFFGQVFGQGCHLSVYRDICVTGFCCAPTELPRRRRVVRPIYAELGILGPHAVWLWLRAFWNTLRAFSAYTFFNTSLGRPEDELRGRHHAAVHRGCGDMGDLGLVPSDRAIQTIDHGISHGASQERRRAIGRLLPKEGRGRNGRPWDARRGRQMQ